MRFRDRTRADADVEAAAVGQRLTRVVGPEPGVFRLAPEDDAFDGPDPAVGPGSVGPGSVGPVWPGAAESVAVEPDEAESGAVEPDAAAGRRALAAFDPGRRAVRALAVLALVVAVVVGFLVWRARPRAEPVTAEPAGVVAAGTEGAAGASGPAVQPSAVIVVSVLGRVQRPGLVRLPHGARVADAIEAAGGVLPGTDLGYLNLARKVVDGELLAVGVTPPPGAAGGAGPGGAAGAPGAPGGLINLNTATVAELDTLPGVGPVLAQRIVDHRTRNGGFRSVEDLRKIEGVGDARFEQLKDLVTV